MRQKFRATGTSPLVCPRCGALNAPSWSSAVIWAAVLPVVFIFVLWAALWFKSWLLFFLGSAAVGVAFWASYRYIPLVVTTPGSVRFSRAMFFISLSVFAVLFLFELGHLWL